VPSRFARPVRTGAFTMRIRAQWDYFYFAMKRLWALGVGIAGLLVGAATLISSQLALVLSAAALIIGVGVFITDALAARQQWSRLKCVYVVSLFPVSKIKLPLGYKDVTYLTIEGRGTMLVHSEADRMLQGEPLPVKLDPTPYELPRELREIAPLALRTMRAGRVIFNGPMLGLRDDLLPGVYSGSHPLRLLQTNFFNQVCSAELCQYRIDDRITGEEREIRIEELVTPSGRLVTLSESRLANNMGISTLAFTADGLLLVVHQSQRNLASGRLLAPSSSGTLEPNDLKATGSNVSLQGLLVHGMERELREETGLSVGDIIETRVIGFGRWLERGAKPEFFGVTRLRISSKDVAGAKISSGEKLYTEQVKPIFVDLVQLCQELRDGHSVEKAPSCPPLVRDSGSLPLIAGLRAVALYGHEWLGVPG
jgi:8-oxo-dGTP pyrophosphatase MutT (NUDIX family)